MTLLDLERLLVISGIIFVFLASQIYWFRRVAELGTRLIANKKWRERLAGIGVITYIFLFAYQLAWIRHRPTPTSFSLESMLVEAPFQWWLVGSLLGFGIAILFWTIDRVGRMLAWAPRRLVVAIAARQGGGLRPVTLDGPVETDPPSPARRRFLEQTALAVSATPFVAAAYGLLYGRLNLQTTHQRIKLGRLPKAFHGFRIAQISDIHIGPFMPSEEIRKYVAITNELRPDLIVLTGDFITWDETTQESVVRALASLNAPFGVFGCLGNHEVWTDTEDSITRLFAAMGTRILRQQRAAVQSGAETLNLLGVDFQSLRGPRGFGGHRVQKYLEGIEPLISRDTVNILLSHNPNAFDRAAELGIELTLAGHTHGGQVTLEYIHPMLSPSRLITDYVSGWFEKGHSQLYVNRGIGTIGVPIRLGAPPELTLFELVRDG